MRNFGHTHTVTYRDGQTAVEVKAGQAVVHHDVNHAIYTISDAPLTQGEVAEFINWVNATWGERREVTVEATLESNGSASVWVS